MRGVVIGIGNDIMRDDAVGLRAARALASHPSLSPDVEVIETGEMGLSLLDVLVNRDWVIFVDSVITGKKLVGYIHRIEGKDVMCYRSKNPHNMGLGEVLYIGNMLDLSIPDEVLIMAMEVRDNKHFGDEMTPEVGAGFTRFLNAVLGEVRKCTSMVSQRA